MAWVRFRIVLGATWVVSQACRKGLGVDLLLQSMAGMPMQQSRAVACLYDPVCWFYNSHGLLDILLKRNSSAPAFQNPNAKVGNGEEMEIDQPQEGRCIVLSEVSRTESFETILKTMRRCKKSVSCQLIAARKHKDLPDLLGKGTRICCPRCDVNSLGDPVPGEDGKHCQCLVSHGRLLTEFEATCDFYLVFRIVS